MTSSNWWPQHYFESRDHFLQTAHSVDADIQSHTISALGPKKQTLTVDVAALVADTDKRRIILCSGLHGVEGYIGASVQIQALQLLAQTGLPKHTGLVVIHAANPWGFAHSRRVDDNNIDLNRNFFHPNTNHPSTHRQYESLDPIINPPYAPNTMGDIRYWLNATRLIVRHRGIRQLFAPIAEGQYDFPLGVFYGGEAVSETTALLQDLITRFSKQPAQVSILDIHSGLGPAAKATLIANTNIEPATTQLDWLRKHFKMDVHSDSAQNNVYSASATFSQWCQRALNKKQYLYLCVEIGTINPVKLFSALKRENQAYHWSGKNSVAFTKTKQTLREAFAPTSEQWRDRSTEQGLHVFKNTLELPSAISAKQ